MAVMGQGKVIARGAPEALISKIKDKVWRKKVSKDEVTQIKTEGNFLSSRHLAGGVIVSVLSDTAPGIGWDKTDPVLEDAYHAHLHGLVSSAQESGNV